jgi:hypothetical protein
VRCNIGAVKACFASITTSSLLGADEMLAFLLPFSVEIAFLVVLILAGVTWKVVRLFGSFWRRWARKGLRTGDLIALRGLTIRDGRWSGPYPDRLQRLRGRGFIEEHEGDKPRVTMKGGVALLFGRRS